jgi:enoyl-CoA hydratase
MSSSVLTEERGQVLIVTINRPDARNAINMDVADGIAGALDLLDDASGLSVGVITGAGRGFSAGMDLKAFAGGVMPATKDRGFAGITERPSRKPLVAAVEGFALAGGLEIALACDLIVSGRDARLGIPEVGVGLFAAAGGLLRLPRRIGLGATRLLALTGAPILAEEGHRVGLVDRLCEPGEALTVAVELAETIARNAPLSVAASKRLLNEGWSLTEADFWAMQRDTMEAVFSSADAREGAVAFAEKRPPKWQGV